MKNKATYHFQSLYNKLLASVVTDANTNLLPLDEGIEKAVNIIKATANVKNKVMVIGNGGSAAIASHIHNDLCKSLGVQALVFTETPLLTALSNDINYEVAYQMQVELWAKENDLLIAISSSGESGNIIKAVNSAKERKCKVITFSGFSQNNPLRQMGDINIYVPDNSYGYVEEMHSVLTHFITDCAAEK